MPKHLAADELNEMKIWLQDLPVKYKNLNRDFSDAVPVASILKKFFPKLLELHNYPSRNNTQLKLNNWETLNHKVLSKLGLAQHKTMLDKLSKGAPGAIELLLYDLMLMIRAQKNKNNNKPDEQERKWSENDDVMTVKVNKMIGDGIVQVPQKMILFAMYEQVLKESQAKDNILIAARQKITHLENILKLREERIEELCAQMAKLSVRSLLSQQSLENSNSFSTSSRLEQNSAKFGEVNTFNSNNNTNNSDSLDKNVV